MKIAIFSTYSYDQDFLERFNTGHKLTFFSAALTELTVSLTEGYTAICIFVNDIANAVVLEKLAENGVRLIVLRCAGYNNVDLQAAENLGIKVLRVPAYAPEAVAEHAMAMILTLNRKTHKAYNRIREGNFSLDKLIGFSLFDCKVALIGTGNIGKAFYKILKGFGCRIVAHDPFPDQELRADGLHYDSLANTLHDAQIVSLHCPLNEQSLHLVNASSLKLFKKGAMLINTSRGALIETADVIEALKTGQLGYLGLDVYEQESSLFFHDRSEDVILDDVIARLISFPNVLITSHQGFLTREAMEQIATITFENVDAFVGQKVLNNQVRH